MCQIIYVLLILTKGHLYIIPDLTLQNANKRENLDNEIKTNLLMTDC